MSDETWPKPFGNGWNTSDGYRFRTEKQAIKHQARVDDPDDQAGTHERTVTTKVVSDEVSGEAEITETEES